MCIRDSFFTVAELYGYGINQKRIYDFGDKKVNYYQNGFTSMINFDFKGDANKSYEELFSSYDKILQNDLKGNTVMNYISSVSYTHLDVYKRQVLYLVELFFVFVHSNYQDL